MERDQILDLVLDIRKKMHECALGIRWPSSEMLASANDRRSTRRGPGDEHDSMKDYEAGDDLKHVDWIATAASGDPDEIIIKTFFEPKVVRFNVLLDVNKSMNFGTHGTLKSRLAALCAACGIHSAAKMKDRVSYVTFAGAPVTCRKSQGASRILTDFLIHSLEDGLTPEAEPGTSDGGGLSAAFDSIRQKNRGIVLVVSDFVNMSEDDWEAMRITGFKHDSIAVFVQDRRERELPEVPWPGASYSFEDFRGNSKTLWVTPDSQPGMLAGLSNAFGKLAARITGAGEITSRAKYRENFRAHEKRILDRLESYGVKTVVVSTEEEADAVHELLRVLANKAR